MASIFQKQNKAEEKIPECTVYSKSKYCYIYFRHSFISYISCTCVYVYTGILCRTHFCSECPQALATVRDKPCQPEDLVWLTGPLVLPSPPSRSLAGGAHTLTFQATERRKYNADTLFLRRLQAAGSAAQDQLGALAGGHVLHGGRPTADATLPARGSRGAADLAEGQFRSKTDLKIN